MFNFIKPLFSRRLPPPPDTSAPLILSGAQIIEEVFSPDKWQRVAILRDNQGIFRVRNFRWCTEDWEIAGQAYWIEADRVNTMTDTLENARRLASEYLAGIK